MIAACIIFGLLMAEHARAEFDSSPWKSFREVRIRSEVPDGPVGIALESALLERCRPDLADLRLVDGDGALVSCTVTDGSGGDEPVPFPARIFRMARKPGAWTDLWLDLSEKVLTSGVLIQTPAKHFVRPVEIRGSDNAKESYVIRLDGLIADMHDPVPVRRLAVFYPVHNFQFVHIRILDRDEAPLKIEGVFCYPPTPDNKLGRPLDARIMENRTETASGTTSLVVDLGDRRFPVTALQIWSPAKEFAKKVTVSAASVPSGKSWNKIHEGTFTRLVSGEASEEMLKARFKPCTQRYLNVMLSGAGRPVAVERVQATGTIKLLTFTHSRGKEYRLFYDNAQVTQPAPAAGMPSPKDVTTLAASAIVQPGPEHRNVTPSKPAQSPARPAPQRSSAGRIAAVLVVLAGLLLLFSVMLKARSWRQSRRQARTAPTRFQQNRERMQRPVNRTIPWADCRTR